jgi:hypothetical protein
MAGKSLDLALLHHDYWHGSILSTYNYTNISIAAEGRLSQALTIAATADLLHASLLVTKKPSGRSTKYLPPTMRL